MTEDMEGFVNAITALARQSSLPFDLPAGGKGIMRPDGSVQALPPLDPPMTHIKQGVKAFDAQAIIAYVNRFKMGAPDEPVTTIFADPNMAKIKSVIDYHEFGPGRCSHYVEATMPFSEQWRRWRDIDGKSLAQIEFAEFLEENCQDIVEPDPATFLDLITNLQAKKKVSFESGVRLNDGSNQLSFSEETTAMGRGYIAVPSEFSIGAPIFDKGDAYKVKCWLRYRIREGSLNFVVKIHRRQFLESTAFADICAKVEAGTGLPVLNAWA